MTSLLRHPEIVPALFASGAEADGHALQPPLAGVGARFRAIYQALFLSDEECVAGSGWRAVAGSSVVVLLSVKPLLKLVLLLGAAIAR